MKKDILVALLVMAAFSIWACTYVHIEGDDNTVTTDNRLRNDPSLEVQMPEEVK